MKNKTISIMGMIGLILIMSSLASAGFGSTYVPSISGKNILGVPIGTNSDYYIYPQNQESKILLVKINVLNGSELITNTLQESYEVPVNTESDEFPIKITLRLANDTSLIGKEYYFSYEILTSYKQNDSEGMVSFSPVGYKKSFYVKGLEAIQVPVTPVNNTPNTTNPVTPSNPSSTSTTTQSTTQVSVTPKVTTPAPIVTQPKPETTKPVEVAVIPTSFLSNFNWEYFIFVSAGIVLIGLIIFFVKARINSGSSDFSGYNQDIVNNQDIQNEIS